MNIEKYLEKLNLFKKAPSLEYLNEIISAHQKTISFNNLAVFYRPGKILDLEIEPLFEKVILRGEGGYCFENNKVFFHLLQGLGFHVEAKAARVLLSQLADPPRTHRTTVVTIEGKKYLADVGFGRDTPNYAVLIGQEQSCGHKVIVKEGRYLHQCLKGDSFIGLYVFDDSTFQESDFNLGNYYTNTHPNSKFTKEVIVSRIDEGLIEFINNKTFTRIENNARKDFEIRNQEEFEQYLRKFGIEIQYEFNKLP